MAHVSVKAISQQDYKCQIIFGYYIRILTHPPCIIKNYTTRQPWLTVLKKKCMSLVHDSLCLQTSFPKLTWLQYKRGQSQAEPARSEGISEWRLLMRAELHSDRPPGSLARAEQLERKEKRNKVQEEQKKQKWNATLKTNNAVIIQFKCMPVTQKRGTCLGLYFFW